MRPATVRLLIVTDDPALLEIARKAVSNCCGDACRVEPADHAESAKALVARGAEKPFERPSLILLDGLRLDSELEEHVRAFKAAPAWRLVPVIAMAPDAPAANAAWRGGANAVVSRPTQAEPLADIARAICEFWTGAAHLPPASAFSR